MRGNGGKLIYHLKWKTDAHYPKKKPCNVFLGIEIISEKQETILFKENICYKLIIKVCMKQQILLTLASSPIWREKKNRTRKNTQLAPTTSSFLNCEAEVESIVIHFPMWTSGILQSA